MADLTVRASRLPQAMQALARAVYRLGCLIAVGLILVYLAVVLGLPVHLPLQAASWLTFIALVITPGYLLGDIVAWRLDLDQLERLALAMPLGVSVTALPGMVCMLGHKTIQDLAMGWTLTVGLLVVIWLVHGLFRRRNSSRPCPPWALSEALMLLLLAAAFIYIFPTLSLYKMDGDAYAVAAFTSDALTGRPLNATEPLLGTGQEMSSVRMEFNQLLPIFHLWSYLPQVDHIELTGYGTRSMLALWAMLASYMLGKAAGHGSRRFGLFTASVQTLIYMSAPFLRTDNVSIFFFERINADKFTVTVTMLPVAVALAISFVRLGRRDIWTAAAIATFAVSSIHALIAAMLALSLGAFGGLHLLLNLRRRQAWKRTFGLALLTVVVMILPLVQFVIARTGDQMAPTFPSSFEGWAIGDRLVPIFPFVLMRNKDVYGPLPNLARLEADDANDPDSPFLVFRYAVNMRRQRIVLFNLKRYICDPTIIMEPPYLLALLLLPWLLPRLRSDLGAQYALSTSLAVLFVMFNPILTPIMGDLVVPWILWRFVWLLPYALTIAMVAQQLAELAVRALTRPARLRSARPGLLRVAPLVVIPLAASLLWPNVQANTEEMHVRGAGPFVYATPTRILEVLREKTARADPVLVLADENISVTIPAFVGNADVVAHRLLTTSESFPAHQQDLALQRHIDQYNFLNTPLLTVTHIDIVQRYNIRYVVLTSGNSLERQLRLSPQWFEWLVDDQSYTLYAVREVPPLTASLQGNAALLERKWETARQHYLAALERDPSDMLALLGMAQLHRVAGEFDQALAILRQAALYLESPAIHYQLGQAYADLGQDEQSIAEFDLAQQGAPSIARFHMALGNACLNAEREDCAREQYEAAVNARGLPDQVSRLTSLASIWQQRGNDDLALSLYEQAVAISPDERTRLLLASVYQRLEQNDKAEALLQTLQEERPLSPSVMTAMGQLMAAKGETEQAVAWYRRAIWLQSLRADDTYLTRLSLAQVLLEADRYDEARREVERVLAMQPENVSAYMFMGGLYREQNQPYLSIAAYRRALELDPTQAAAYASLSDQYRRQAIPPDETAMLLEAATSFNPDQAALVITLADQFQRLGDIHMAIDTYQLALSLLDQEGSSVGGSIESTDRYRALAYSRMAALYEDLGQVPVAMSYYKAAVAAAPTESWVRVSYADALRRRNSVDAAEIVYRRAIAMDPSYIDSYLHLASMLSARGDTSTASELHQRALEAAKAGSDPVQVSRALVGLGDFYDQARMLAVPLGSDEEPDAVLDQVPDPITQQALEAYTQALETEADLAAVFALARLYQEIDQADQAVELYQQRIEQEKQGDGTPTLLGQYYVGLADVYVNQGRYDQAIATYKRAIELDSWSPSARLGLARVLSEHGDQAGAMAEFQKAVEIAPGSVQAQIALADALDQQGEKEQALAVYQATAQAHPGNSAANLALARAWQDRHRWDEAERSYRQVLAVLPGEIAAYVGLANLYILQNRNAEAEALLRQAIPLDRTDATACLRLGQLLARQARYDEALAAYQSALAIRPGDWQVYVGLAGVYQALGQVNRALENFRMAAAIDQTVPTPLVQLAALYQEQNEPDLAEEMYLQALDRSKDDAAIRQALAAFYQSQAMDDEALVQLRLAVEENPGSMAALVSYGDGLRRQARDREAEQVYRRAEQVGKPSAEGYRSLAIARQAQGREDEALALLEQAIAYAPDDATNWIQKGQLQMQMGNTNAALASLEHSTQLEPGLGEAWYTLGTTLLAAGKRQEAMVAFERAIAVEPTYLPAYGSLAEYYQGLGQHAKAEEIVEAAQSAVPGSYLGHVYAARLLESQLVWDAASRAWSEAIATAPGVLDAYLRLGQLQRNRGQYVGALATYQRAVQVAPGDWQAYVGLAGVYQSLGQIEQAIEILREAAALDHTATGPSLQLAALYQEQNQPDLAEEMYLQALGRSPHNATIRQALAGFYGSMALEEEALVQLRLAAQENPSSIPALVSYGDQLRLLGRDEEAEAIYQRAEQVGEPSAAGYRALAVARQTQGRMDDALRLIEQAIAFDPTDSMSWITKSQLQDRLGDSDAAMASLQQATQLGPGQAQTWLSLGNALLTEGKSQEALAALEQAIAVAPTNLPAYRALIRAHQDLGNDDQAAQTVTAARAAVPGSYLGDMYAADFLEEKGLWDEARDALAQAMAKAPGVPDPFVSMGGLELRQGKVDQAMDWYEQAIRLRPGDRNAITSLIDLLLRQGENEAALATVQGMLKARPGDGELLLRLGSIQRILGHYAEAESAYHRAADISRADDRPYAELADLYLAQGKPVTAIAAYQQAIALNPGDAAHYLALSQLWMTQGQPDQALALLEEAVTRVTQPSSVYVAIANLYLRQGEPERALQVLEGAIQQGQEDSQLLQALAAYHLSRAEFQQADQIYKQMLASDADQATTFIALADGYLQRGHILEAESQYKQALALEPSNAAVYLALAGLYQRLGQTQKAIDQYSQALRLNPTLDNAYVSLASLYQSQACWAEAQATYEHGLAVAPTSTQLLTQYNAFLFQRGDVRRALANLDQATALSARAETFMTRSDLYVALGRIEEARRDLQRAIDIEPGSVNAWVSLGNLYSARDDLKKAEQAYRQAVSVSPGTATGYLSLADLAYGQGDLDEAWRQYQAAIRAEPASADPWVRLGQAHSEQRDWVEAEMAYRRALSLSPLATEAYIGMADMVWQSSGDLERALNWLRQASEPGFDLATVYRAIGDMYRQAGQSGLTAGYFQQAVGWEPGSPEGYLSLSELYLAQGLPWEAEHYASLALEVSPRSPAAYRSLGDIYLALGDTSTAERNYRSAIALDTTPTESYLALAKMYTAQAQYTQAINTYKEAIQLDPTNWSLWTAVGNAYSVMGDCDDVDAVPVYCNEALTAFQQAIQVAPEEWSAWVSLGNFYTNMGEYDAALSAFDQAAKLNPESPEPWLRKGNAFQMKGDVWAAQIAFEQARALSPNDTGPLLSLAGLFQEQGDLEEAERFARQAIELDPLDAAGYITLGSILEEGSYTLARYRRVLTDVDKANEAATYYWKAIQLNPRQIGTYKSWLALHVDVGLRHRDLTPLQVALGELAHSSEAETLQGHVALGLGYWTNEGPTDRAIYHLQQASVLDPVFAELYGQIARAYEERMESRLAISAWRRYVYAATGTGSDASEGQAHIAWLQGVRIERPTDGANVSGQIEVVGAATRDDFLFYTLEYTPVGQPEAWVTIGEPGYQPVNYGQLGTWETGPLPPGDYLLRLKVVDTNQGYGPYDQATVRVRNVQGEEPGESRPSGRQAPAPTQVSVPLASLLTATTPAPILSPPAGGFTLLKPLLADGPSNGHIDFEWEWTGDVPPQFGFEVRVWREGEPPYAAHNSVLDNRYGLIENLGGGRFRLSMDISAAASVRGRAGIYLWTVALVQIGPAYADLGLQAEPARLRYDGGGAIDEIK